MLLVGTVSISFAGTYASGLRATNPDSTQAFDGSFVDGTGAKLWFTLNGHADTVKVWVLSNNTRIKSFAPIYNLGAGQYNVLWDGKDDGAANVTLGNYTFEVFTSDTGNSTTNWVQAWQNKVYTGVGMGLSARDVDVVRDPTSPWFGNLIMGEPSVTYGYARVLVANADGSKKVSFGDQYYPLPPSGVEPWYLSVAQNGNFYVSCQLLNKIHVYKDTVLVSTIDVTLPRGIATMGAGDPTLFMATAGIALRRVPAGTVDTIFNTSGGYVRDVAVDDSGYIYISFGASSTTYTKVVRLSPARVPLDTLVLPGLVTHLAVSYGANRASNVDDILYARVSGAYGIYKLDFAAKSATLLFSPVATTTSGYHAICADVLGNIYYSNPTDEWVRMYVPPASAPTKWTTKGGSLNLLPVATKVIDAFDAGAGHFGLAPTYSGSTVGIDPTSTAQWTQAERISDIGGAMEINLIDNPTVTDAWGVRFLSGGGTFTANDSLGAVGFIGYWLKTSTAPAGATVAIGLDDPSDPTTKRSIQLSVINDGEWHLYQWNIGDSAHWTAWVASKARIVGPRVSIDAVWFFAPDGSAPWKLYLDNVSYNPSTRLGNEPGRGDVTNNGIPSALDASWILQNVVKIRPFNPQQVMAGDVNLSHNGTEVNALDASIVLAYVVKKVPYLPWTQALPPLMNTSKDEPAPLSIIVASVSGAAGKIVTIPISVPGNLAGLRSAEMEVTYNASALKIRSVSSTGLTKDFAVVSNIKDGVTSIAMASGDALAVGGQILMMEAEILQTSENISLTIDKIQLNDRAILKVTSVANGQAAIPETFALLQNYPNPFNPSTTIEFQMPKNGFVELKVYDVAGREITTLISEMKNAGAYHVTWNGVDKHGANAASGVYFYRINAGSFTQIKKMLLLK